MKAIYGIVFTLVVLAACSSEQSEKHKAKATMIYSPNGQPLSGGPLGMLTCEQALGGWFDRLSAGSGHITEVAFMTDAHTQFQAMDIDHKGYIVSEELDRYRAPYRQQTYVQNQSDKTNADEIPSKGHKHKGKSGKDSTSQSDPSLSLSDPVMSADTNLDFKVTPEEFMTQAHAVFAKLDSTHDGSLDRTELVASCTPKEP